MANSTDMQRQVVLTLNAGSSSLKFSLMSAEATPQRLMHGAVEGIGSDPRWWVQDEEGQMLQQQQMALESTFADLLTHLLAWLQEFGEQHQLQLAMVGHRVVHGGSLYSGPVPIDGETLHQLRQFVSLAPLHQPSNLLAIDRIAETLPNLPQVACFDTAFHADQPATAKRFALPRHFEEEGVRRYGFHGLSYDYISQQLPTFLTPSQQQRVIVAHLGSGASMCALKDGHSIDSTMGFTALDGLMMGTRCGNLDPGVLLYLLEQCHYSVDQVSQLLHKQSGLLGVSGISNDVRTLLASDEPAAAEAIDLFIYRVVRELGALIAVLGGLDTLVFTAGIGERSPYIRERIVQQLGFLGAQIDEQANLDNAQVISGKESQVVVSVVATDEEWVIAQQTVRVVLNA